MQTTVTHSRGKYTVEVTSLHSVLERLGHDDFVVTDDQVRVALGLAEGCFSFPPGEESKSLDVYGRLLDWLSARAHRSSRVVAVGGGVVGDLAGFAAATYMRGVRFLQVPTSLMAMVDSSVGGKVGIDLAGGKNLAGAFWPPEQVLVPVDSLESLPDRQFVNGAAEVWKYGAILDAGLFERLSEAPLSKEQPELAEIVMRCIELKKGVVEKDEHETSGLRAILNFGHTVGHAIEHAMGYQKVLHGEAVAIGMVVECRLGEKLGVTMKETTERLTAGLRSQGLPTCLPEGLASSLLIEPMKRDKKSDGNGLAFSLVSEIGACKLYRGIAEADVALALEEM